MNLPKVCKSQHMEILLKGPRDSRYDSASTSQSKSTLKICNLKPEIKIQSPLEDTSNSTQFLVFLSSFSVPQISIGLIRNWFIYFEIWESILGNFKDGNNCWFTEKLHGFKTKKILRNQIIWLKNQLDFWTKNVPKLTSNL
jgi:hypothetical protein